MLHNKWQTHTSENGKMEKMHMQNNGTRERDEREVPHDIVPLCEWCGMTWLINDLSPIYHSPSEILQAIPKNKLTITVHSPTLPLLKPLLLPLSTSCTLLFQDLSTLDRSCLPSSNFKLEYKCLVSCEPCQSFWLDFVNRMLLNNLLSSTLNHLMPWGHCWPGCQIQSVTPRNS